MKCLQIPNVTPMFALVRFRVLEIEYISDSVILVLVYNFRIKCNPTFLFFLQIRLPSMMDVGVILYSLP